PPHGFLLEKGVFTTIDYPGAEDTVPKGINILGQIVGFWGDGEHGHGFLLTRNGFETIDFPGVTDSGSTAINPRGQIVGIYFAEDGSQHGYVRTRGSDGDKEN